MSWVTDDELDSPRFGVPRRAILTAALAGAGLVAAAPARATVPRGRALPPGNYRIDLHSHFLPPEYRAALLSRGMLTIGGYPTPDWSPEAAIDFQDRYGIAAQVLSASDPGVEFLEPAEAVEMARYCNEYAAGLFRSHPGRFGGLAVLPMHNVVDAIAELTHALDVLHLDGVVLLSAYRGVYLGDPRFEPLMYELNRRSAYVFVHPASIPPDAKAELPLPDFLMEFTFDTTRAAALLMASGTRDRYPNIRFQLAHAGGTLPYLASRIGVASKTVAGAVWPEGVEAPSLLGVDRLTRGFYYDTALSAAPAPMRAVESVTGLDHVVFGSDWPFSAMTLSGAGDPQPGLSEVFTDDQRVAIERDNALRELPRLAGQLR